MQSKMLVELWDTYRLRVIPEAASPVQILETRRGFYAGMASMFTLISDVNAAEADAALADMKRIQSELLQFARGIGKGN